MLKEKDIEWFRPLWLRVVVTGGLAVWCGIEWWNGNSFWGLLTGAALAYSVYNFFITFPPKAGEEPAAERPASEEPPNEPGR